MMSGFLIVLALLILFPRPAHAYLDPGSGSMMIQLLLAGVAGAGVALKLAWKRVTSVFNRSKKS